MSFFTDILDNDFMPHGHCYFWKPEVLWTNVIGDGIIVVAYYSIPFLLFYFINKRKDLKYKWMFLLFALFIFACGTTHLIDIVTVWNPVYRLEGAVKMLTGLISITTAILLIPVIPSALRIPSRKELKRANSGLQKEIERSKKMEMELREKTHALEQSNEELERFAYIASHDLQEPLRKITAFSDRLKRIETVTQNERAGEYLDRMQNASLRMGSLIDNLLEYSRLSTREMPTTHIDLNKVMTHVLNDLEITINEKNAVIEYGDLPDIQGNEVHITQLFQNLLSNSLKFVEPGVEPHIQIRHEAAENGMIMFQVEDNGIGFDNKHAVQIFQPFQRLHGKSAFDGSGIGLAICKKIVERHGGAISAHGEKGKGAVFTFTLPAA